MIRPCILLTILSLALAGTVRADIYKHVDENGNITFTNRPMKGAQRILIEPSPPPSNTAYRTKSPAGLTRPAASALTSFPRIDADTQKKRDLNRRDILEEELASERRLLAERRQELAQAEARRSTEDKHSPHQEQLLRLRENLLLHERNITALQSELGKLR